MAIITALAIVGGVFSLINYRRENTWQERTRAADLHAADVQTRLDATNAELDLAQTELKVMSIGLTASNKERDALQVRIEALAAEPANAADQQQLSEQSGNGDVVAAPDP